MVGSKYGVNSVGDTTTDISTGQPVTKALDLSNMVIGGVPSEDGTHVVVAKEAVKLAEDLKALLGPEASQ
ncbi:hypothetical protein GPA10_39315 [Streptomyces sp. p1417]|uniref:Uncharacterized protein n=1 Tax=Streptomyces typhae TaxID=2681492 RepID=A0A6L6X9M0_9ACTN|nr:hypothetical protein [Streptomyces typhae]MVO90643.1 hypothetical protein [Streptomyces typhae]